MYSLVTAPTPVTAAVVILFVAINIWKVNYRLRCSPGA